MAKIFYGWNIGKETSSKQNVVGSWLKVNAPVVTHVLSMVVLALKKQYSMVSMTILLSLYLCSLLKF